MAVVSVALATSDYEALCRATQGSGLPAAVDAILGRAVDNGDGTRTLTLNPSIAWMLVTSLTTTFATRPALTALDAAYWAAGGPDTGRADRSLVARAHERGAEILDFLAQRDAA